MTNRLDTLLPSPSRTDSYPGEFVLTSHTTIVSLPGADTAAVEAVRRTLSFLPLPLGDSVEPGAVSVATDSAMPDEGYQLRVHPDRVEIKAGSVSGAFYAGQTLRQLLHPDSWRTAPPRRSHWVVPCCEIEDAPRMTWRGAHLDVARTFFPKHAILRMIDMLAMHKLNRLHLHLTDDHGWRVESRRFPELHERGSHRKRTQTNLTRHEAAYDGTPHGGYYTLDDLAEIAQYAADRAVTIVPEIDVPGHASALLAARRDLGSEPGRSYQVWERWGGAKSTLAPLPEAVDFLVDVFDEVFDAVPTPYAHIGGDECFLDVWETNPRIVDYRRSLGLRDSTQLLAHFIRELADRLADRGKRVVAWDEAFVSGGLRPDSIVMAWRGERIGQMAALAGHDVIMTPILPTYLNCYAADDSREPLAGAGPIRLEDVAAFRPVPASWAGMESRRAIGTQFILWTELISNERMLDYMAFPRGSLIAEAAWNAEPEPWPALRTRLAGHLQRLDAAGVEYRPLDGPRPWQEGGTGWLQFRRGIPIADLVEHHDMISDKAEAPTEAELASLLRADDR